MFLFKLKFASSRIYNIFRDETLELAEKAPFSDRLGLKSTLQKLHDSAKSFFSPPSMLFEQLGWRYFGTVDGHNLNELIKMYNKVSENSENLNKVGPSSPIAGGGLFGSGIRC